MRLLHTRQNSFKEFFDTQVPRYAILSHRWGDSEVSYREMRKGIAPEGQGLRKIHDFCALASTDGFEWVWIDTCCIDKKSSAELSEAINSMFRWYGNAEKCYVYLSDMSSGITFDAQLSASSWFTRGWTLQELLAPRRIVFYNFQWERVGDMDALCYRITAITGIPTVYLTKLKGCSTPFRQGGPSVAERMSWAARRVTSRSEDMAYCLIGLFDINMPLLYGEGAEKSFLRLQQEIIKQEDDESIFAWEANLSICSRFGLLSPSPSFFAKSGNIAPSAIQVNRQRFWMTNKGLALDIATCPYSGDKSRAVDIQLGCSYTGEYARLSSVVALKVHSQSDNTWFRSNITLTRENLGKYDPNSDDPSSVIYIPQISAQTRLFYSHGTATPNSSLDQKQFRMIKIKTSDTGDGQKDDTDDRKDWLMI